MVTAALRRSSTVDELVDVLQDEILDGRYPPGTPMRELEFAERFDVSRNTLREALHRLVDTGLVEHRPHRGVQVARPGVPEVREIYQIRRLLETEGLRTLGHGRGQELMEIGRAISRASQLEDWPGLGELDAQFHLWLVRRLESPRLTQLVEGAFRELRLVFLMIDRASAGIGPPSHVPDHEAIASLVANGRISEGADLLRRHLSNAEDMVLVHLSEMSAEGGEVTG